MPDASTEVLRTVYTEVCKAHNDIADFRAKLLALLPVVSGAGILYILHNPPESADALVAIGTFGVLFTLGLFVYELDGIKRCIALIHCGEYLEEKLEERWLSEKGRPRGMFNDPSEALIKDYLGPKGAALLIYPTVIGGWGYVISMASVAMGSPWLVLVPPVLFALAVLAGVLAIRTIA
jgi:hypothetical protein